MVTFLGFCLHEVYWFTVLTINDCGRFAVHRCDACTRTGRHADSLTLHSWRLYNIWRVREVEEGIFRIINPTNLAIRIRHKSQLFNSHCITFFVTLIPHQKRHHNNSGSKEKSNQQAADVGHPPIIVYVSIQIYMKRTRWLICFPFGSRTTLPFFGSFQCFHHSPFDWYKECYIQI